ncbi:hypothetical protein GF369_03315 [Candidatus Peregrinibacteria bacterium]|nr:hypothetical protein [Candidatus Peregrinibacteria bacterium]
MRTITFGLLLSLLLVSFAGCSTDPVDGEMSSEDITVLAQCLGEKDVLMYGSIGCGHCQNQKDAFGDSFQYINYIECNPNVDLDSARKCQAAGINGVPTWKFPDGTEKVGETSLPELAEAAGC